MAEVFQILLTEVRQIILKVTRIASVNASEAMFLRIDTPSHIKHKQGDTFDEVYLSNHLGVRRELRP